jgi:superfamily II DNA or RNA helicase
MRITFKGLFGHIEREASEWAIFKHLRTKFSWLNPDRYKIESFRKGWWDGRTYMISEGGQFLRGLAAEIAAEARAQEYTVDYRPYELEWAGVAASYLKLVDSLALEGIELAEHQRRMTRELLRAGGGTVEGVTGCGKTESITLLARILLEFTEPVFFLVHRIGLMRGAYERVKMRCPELANVCGLLGDGERPKPTDKIIFSTVQTLSSVHGFIKLATPDKDLMKLWAGAGAVIIDEAHRVVGGSYLRLLRRVQEAPIFQFTGTPEVDDPVSDWTVIGVGGPIVTRVKRSEMERIGFIAEAVACAREFKTQLDGPGRRKKIRWTPEKDAADYYVEGLRVDRENGSLERVRVKVDREKGLNPDDDETYLYPEYGRDMLILQESRNADMLAFVRASLDANRPVLVLCEKIAQLYYLRRCFTAGGLPPDLFGVLHGSHSAKQRGAVVGRFETGEIAVLLASTIFDEGEDIKGIGSVVLAAGGASLVRVVQRIGRGVRAKDAAIGNYTPIWMPVDYLTKYSREHTEARILYLQRAEITTEEATGDWPAFFKYLHSKFSQNITRVL